MTAATIAATYIAAVFLIGAVLLVHGLITAPMDDGR